MRATLRTWAWAGLALLALYPLVARPAEPDLRGVGDPTRPPPGVMLKQFGAAGGSAPADAGAVAALGGVAAAAPAASAASAAESPFHGLSVTSIRIDLATGEGVAVVGDDVVKVGDKVRGMTVIEITHDTVVLKGQAETRRLVLPDVIEQSRASARAAKRGRKDRR
ncbi:MAG: hypothetical protein HYX43_08510 [Burkholderiales bacterium]|nr:hypothetical protein [Burkholderiales bacterium]